MPDRRIDDLKQRALTTIAELRTSRGEIAETLRPYRVRHVEYMIDALRAYAENAGTPESERADAHGAVEEIEKQLQYTGGK